MKGPGFWQKAIRFLLIVQLAFPAALVPARAEAGTPPLIPESRETAPVSPLLDEAFADPLVDTVKALGRLPNTVPVSAHDATVDADPFFLRAQGWEPLAEPAAVDEEASQVAFSSAPDHFRIALRGSRSAWRVAAPLHPIYFDGERIFLSPNRADFYSRCPGGEGIFVVLYDELAAAAGAGDRVPIYFVPLPEGGWWGGVRALAFPEMEKVVLADNRGETLPIEERDLDDVLQAAKTNLNLAVAAGIRAAAITGTIGKAPVLPPRGSTAGFGMLFTGYDWDRPELSLFRSDRWSWRDPADAFRRLGEWAVPSARASELFAAPELVRSLLWVLSVTASTYFASMALKYTAFRKYFAERRAQQQATAAAKPEPAPRSWIGRAWHALSNSRVGHEAGEIGQVFAHSMSLLYFFPKVWFGKGLQYVIDTQFPHLNSARNSLTRRFLDWSVYYTSSVSERVPVNLRTLMMQILILGGVNSTSYVAQLYLAGPWVENHLADAFPALRSRVDEALARNNGSIASFRHNELVREVTSQLTNPNFAGYLKDYYTNVAASEVDAILADRNILPGDPRYESQRKALLTEKVTQKLEQFGLPSNRDFLFDAATLWSFVTRKVFGFQPPKDAPAGNYAGVERPGLIAPAVRGALAEAKRRAGAHPNDPAFASAVRLLEEASGQLSLLGTFAKYPFRVIADITRGRAPPSLVGVARAVRRLRELLVALTYEGSVGVGVRELPSPWVKAVGEPGARVAGELFRREFLGFSSGRPELAREPSELEKAAEREKVAGRREAIEAAALTELESRYEAELRRLAEKSGDLGEARRALAEAHPAELRYLQDAGWRQTIAERVEAETPYAPPRWGWYRRRQERRAKRIAAERFQGERGRAFNPATSDPDELAHWNRVYAETMMNQVAIYPDYEAAPGLKERVEWTAGRELATAMSDPKAKAYVDSLPPEARVDFVATLYAEAVTRNYVELTATSDAVPADSTAQPGRFQWLRQTKFVRGSRFLTRALRGLEAFFPVEAHQAGFWPRMFRSIPGAYDLAISSWSNYRNAVTALLAVVPYRFLLWGFAPSPHMWVLTLLTAPLGLAPVAILNRFCRMQGLQPMARLRNMLIYAGVFAWVNWADVIPNMLFEHDFRNFAEALRHGLGGIGDAVAAPLRACASYFGLLR